MWQINSLWKDCMFVWQTFTWNFWEIIFNCILDIVGKKSFAGLFRLKWMREIWRSDPNATRRISRLKKKKKSKRIRLVLLFLLLFTFDTSHLVRKLFIARILSTIIITIFRHRLNKLFSPFVRQHKGLRKNN